MTISIVPGAVDWDPRDTLDIGNWEVREDFFRDWSFVVVLGLLEDFIELFQSFWPKSFALSDNSRLFGRFQGIG